METLNLDKKKILEYQQNKDPYLFVDCATEIIPGKSAKGYKKFNESEWYFKVHWPSDPNVPGMLQIEALVQMSSLTIVTDFIDLCPSNAACIALRESFGPLGVIATTEDNHPHPPSLRCTSLQLVTIDTAALIVGARGNPISVLCSLPAGNNAWKIGLFL